MEDPQFPSDAQETLPSWNEPRWGETVEEQSVRTGEPVEGLIENRQKIDRIAESIDRRHALYIEEHRRWEAEHDPDEPIPVPREIFN